MIESRTRRVGRTAWGVVLSLASPGLGLIYARRLWPGLVLLVIDQALSSAILALTQAYAPLPRPMLYAGLLFGLGLAMRLIVAWLVARRLREARPPVRWFRSTWFLALLGVGAGLGIDAASPPMGWRAFSVPSGSMTPTLRIGDYFMADVRTPGARPLAGDVVVFTAPGPDGLIFVKRVVGLPGDRVQVRTGHLLVNGRPTGQRAEPPVETEDGEGRRYVETLPSGRSFHMQKLSNDGPMNDTPEYVVPPGNLFVMGDNRDNSLDSRSLGLRSGGSFGFVPFPNLLGSATLLYWPPDRALTPVE